MNSPGVASCALNDAKAATGGGAGLASFDAFHKRNLRDHHGVRRWDLSKDNNKISHSLSSKLILPLTHPDIR